MILKANSIVYVKSEFDTNIEIDSLSTNNAKIDEHKKEVIFCQPSDFSFSFAWNKVRLYMQIVLFIPMLKMLEDDCASWLPN